MIALLFLLIHLSAWERWVFAFPDEGKWQWVLNQDTPEQSVAKSLFAGSQIFMEIICKAKTSDSKVTISWSVSEPVCWNDHSVSSGSNDKIPDSESIKNIRNNATVTAQEITTNCSGHIMLNEMKFNGGKGPPSDSLSTGHSSMQSPGSMDVVSNLNKVHNKRSPVQNLKKDSLPPLFEVSNNGFYILELRMRGSDFEAHVHVDMLGPHGYLSAADWPLLPFYGIMCLVYVFFGLTWLIVSFCQWRELLRIQFWIGGVILLGMLEKAIFYAEFQNINSTGVNVKALVLSAEWVSCAKRTLARMLVIIVSLGFGIVKPRLGSMLHRLVCVGACYFILAVVESYIRVVHPKNYPSNQLLIASIPLAVLDSAICWWIFTALIQTTRSLRLRRNLVKLSLYRHFTNTLVFAVLASVIFMLYSIKVHRLAFCVTDWRNLWIDEAYWHVLFSVLLLVIMILWRPTNNNQRYAFTPLLDAAEDDEEEDLFVNDAYGVKMRGHSRPTSPKPKQANDEDILKWVDENIPSAGVETALPIFDSEEEILTTKYEVSKMQ